MFATDIYIQETTSSLVPLAKSYLKDEEGTVRVYTYLPLVNYSAADLKWLDNLYFLNQIPKSVYDQILINMPLASSGEFERTEDVLLPSANEIYAAIEDIPALFNTGLFATTDTLSQLVLTMDGLGYLATFNNSELFSTMSNVLDANITITADYTAVSNFPIIIADSTLNDILITLPNDAENGFKWTIKVDDKTTNSISVISEAPALIDGFSDALEIGKTSENMLNNSITFYFNGTNYNAI